MRKSGWIFINIEMDISSRLERNLRCVVALKIVFWELSMMKSSDLLQKIGDANLKLVVKALLI